MTTLLCAQECFEKANQLFSRAHYLDAQALYDRAHALEPNNQIYVNACQRLPNMALAFWKKGKPSKLSATDACDCSANCCECCGEGLGEGYCEGLCESCCDGCDCDCG